MYSPVFEEDSSNFLYRHLTLQHVALYRHCALIDTCQRERARERERESERAREREREREREKEMKKEKEKE